MKLVDLDARFIDSGDRRGVGVLLHCPCGRPPGEFDEHLLYVPFDNPLDGLPRPEARGWQRIGETIETLTLNPSVLRLDPDGCRWHGWIRDGEAISC